MQANSRSTCIHDLNLLQTNPPGLQQTLPSAHMAHSKMESMHFTKNTLCKALKTLVLELSFFVSAGRNPTIHPCINQRAVKSEFFLKFQLEIQLVR